jgi:hypothetical protein
VAALEILSQEAPVFLGSIAGAENGRRLLQKFPVLGPFVSGCFGNEEFPLHLGAARVVVAAIRARRPSAMSLRCKAVPPDVSPSRSPRSPAAISTSPPDRFGVSDLFEEDVGLTVPSFDD